MKKNIFLVIFFLVAVFAFGVYFSDFAHAQTFQISGVVFEDINSNAVPDSGEPRLSGRTVELYTGPEFPPNVPPYCCDIDTGRRTTTDSNGGYVFTGLTAGENWRVRHVVPSGYVRTTDDSRYFIGIAQNLEHNFGIVKVVPPPPSPPPPGPTAVDQNIIWGIFNPLRGNPQNVFDVIFMIADWLLNIAGTLIVILIIYAGIRFMLSRGNPGEIAKAKGILFWALIGFAAVLIGKGFIYLIETILEGNFPTIP